MRTKPELSEVLSALVQSMDRSEYSHACFTYCQILLPLQNFCHDKNDTCGSSSQLYTPSWLCSAKNLSKTKQKQLILRQLRDSVFGPCRIGGADGRPIHLYPTLLPVPNKTCGFCGLPPKFACSVILRDRTSRQADLSRQKTYFVVKNTCLSEQTRICRDRTFVTTIMILVAPPVNETLQAGCAAPKSKTKQKQFILR